MTRADVLMTGKVPSDFDPQITDDQKVPNNHISGPSRLNMNFSSLSSW